MRHKRIVVLGICTVDMLARPIDSFPEPGGLRLFDELTTTTGGNAVNCAIALAKLGIPARIVIKVGGDWMGRFILDELQRFGVDTTDVIRDEQGQTPFTFVCVRSDGERSFLHTMGTNATLRADEISADAFRDSDYVFATGAMLMETLDGTPLAGVLQQARASGALTILDTSFVSGRPQEEWCRAIEPCLPHADWFVPSRPEAQAITATPDPITMARALHSVGANGVVIKLDSEGVLLAERDAEPIWVPALRVDRLIDATGAGDCWCAGFIAGISRGDNPVDAARIGNAVAAHCIQHVGATAGIPQLGEVKPARGLPRLA
ncbi:MAG TPA: carbohydrate kinase family protein [Phycisphaerae bacterium]